MKKLLIATNNPGKVSELLELLKGTGLQLILPAALGINLHVTEDGQTYAENAARKAIAFARASRLTSLADDSGLEVEALNGAPGLLSARYVPTPGASDADRRAALLAHLHGKARPWKACFRAVIAIASPDGKVELAEGICQGEIIPDERGTGGFGYDPIFLLSEAGKTMAELSMEEKNRLSHRSRAVQNGMQILEKLSAE